MDTYDYWEEKIKARSQLESAFYILKYTYAACVLTENGFMDSPLSLAFLESDEGKKAIIALHVDGIIDFIQQRANEPL